MSNQIGELFKQKRKERNLSLKEVESATSIRMVYLQAIEEGSVSKMLSPVYAEGFLKQYAAYLGMDGEDIIRKHPELFGPKGRQEFAYGIGTLEMRGTPGSGIKIGPNILWAIAFLLLLISAWVVARYLEVV
jgi:cytoskeletal protein RodZ